MKNTISKTIALRLLKKMIRIRMAEERIAEIYPQGEMRTPTHFSVGQEAVSAGVCDVLKKGDAVFASHRCHAAYLAGGGDLNGMVAELFGRATGVCGGRSGSAHLSSPGHNMFSAPILGGLIPVAVGAAFSFAMDKSKNIAVAFFGDAASEEGVFAESLNFAIIKKLPVLFVCENNFYSTNIHLSQRQPDVPLYQRVKSSGIESVNIDGNDAIKVYLRAKDFASKIRLGGGPKFIECVTYRHLEHVGPNYDFDNPYRTEKEVRSWMKRCPVKRLRKHMINTGAVTESSLVSFEKKVMREIDKAIEKARNDPWPGAKDLLRDVY